MWWLTGIQCIHAGQHIKVLRRDKPGNRHSKEDMRIYGATELSVSPAIDTIAVDASMTCGGIGSSCSSVAVAALESRTATIYPVSTLGQIIAQILAIAINAIVRAINIAHGAGCHVVPNKSRMRQSVKIPTPMAHQMNASVALGLRSANTLHE